MKAHRLLDVVAQLAVQRFGQFQGLEIGGVIVAVEDGVNLFKGPWLNLSVPVAFFEQFFGVLHHLERRGAHFARLHFDVGGVQAICGANFSEIVGLGFAAFGDDQEAVMAGAAASAAV